MSQHGFPSNWLPFRAVVCCARLWFADAPQPVFIVCRGLVFLCCDPPAFWLVYSLAIVHPALLVTVPCPGYASVIRVCSRRRAACLTTGRRWISGVSSPSHPSGVTIIIMGGSSHTIRVEAEGYIAWCTSIVTVSLSDTKEKEEKEQEELSQKHIV